jgi:hypothetical protein
MTENTEEKAKAKSSDVIDRQKAIEQKINKLNIKKSINTLGKTKLSTPEIYGYSQKWVIDLDVESHLELGWVYVVDKSNTKISIAAGKNTEFAQNKLFLLKIEQEVFDFLMSREKIENDRKLQAMANKFDPNFTANLKDAGGIQVNNGVPTRVPRVPTGGLHIPEGTRNIKFH